MIRLAIVSPCYNEQEVLNESAHRLTSLLKDLIARKKIAANSYILYVNDGSKDDTWQIISSLHQTNPFINGLNLAHNVGHQNALMAGMMTAKDKCDGVVTIDCDLQDDLNAIEKMVDLHEAGNDIIYGVKVSREADSFMKKLTAQTFYKLQASMGVKAVYNHADFRFLSRRVIEALAQYPERNLYLRGIIPTIGFQTATVDEVIGDRIAGQSKFTLAKMLRLASDGITSFSAQPMTIVLVLGIVMLAVALGMGVYVLVSLLMGHYVAGWSSLMLSMWFIGAVITIGIGICGAYIGKIYTEIKHRPLYIIADQLIHE